MGPHGVCIGTYPGGRSSPLSFLVSSYFALLQQPVCRVFALGHLIPGFISNGKHIQRVSTVPLRSVQSASGSFSRATWVLTNAILLKTIKLSGAGDDPMLLS
jgi:hypothetical protein